LALLGAIYAPTTPEWFRFLPAVETLRLLWVQQFYAPQPDGSIKWRTVKDLPPSTIAIHSPHDVQAHYSSKRSIDWVGYKVHLTEIYVVATGGKTPGKIGKPTNLVRDGKSFLE